MLIVFISKKNMKAIKVIEENLVISETPVPLPGDDEVLIKVKAAGINRADIAQRKGLYPPPPGASEILGLECSGIIETVGKNVSARQPGDEVIALLGGGGYGEYVTCPQFHTLHKPANLDWIEAASIPEVYATCWLNLFMEASMKEGDKVVFHAGASGIGTAGIQLAKAFRCESFVSAGSENKIDMCINLGASDGEVRSRDIFSKIKSWAPEGVDVILDPVGAEYFESNLNVLGIEGRLVIIGLMSGAQTNLNLGHLMIKRQKIIGSTIRARNVETKNIVMQELSQKVLPLFKSGELIPIIHETYPLSESEKAHEIMEANENIGKIILTLD
jgi:putative PIG3 family NAD(P)H quinone oxidoreductase